MEKKGLENFLEKEVILFYDDGRETAGKKEGKLTSFDDITLIVDTTQGRIAVPINRVIRIEEKVVK